MYHIATPSVVIINLIYKYTWGSTFDMSWTLSKI